MINYIKIQPNQLQTVWTKVAPIIQRAIDAGFDNTSPEIVRRGITKNQLHLFIGIEDDEVVIATVVSFLEQPFDTVLHVNLLAGSNLPDAMENCWPNILQWAKDNGASKVEAFCHPVMYKLLEKYKFTSKQIIATLEL